MVRADINISEWHNIAYTHGGRVRRHGERFVAHNDHVLKQSERSRHRRAEAIVDTYVRMNVLWLERKKTRGRGWQRCTNVWM